jgi:hypothetical protein
MYQQDRFRPVYDRVPSKIRAPSLMLLRTGERSGSASAGQKPSAQKAEHLVQHNTGGGGLDRYGGSLD